MSGGSHHQHNNNKGGEKKNAMEMVEIVKEIVKNCSDDEIYDVLQECNMNPDDAVQKLLYQDHFHEVKSRREKKKEIKEASESRSQAGTLTRNLGRGGSMQYRTAAPEPSRGRSMYKEEYSSTPVTSSVPSVSSVDGNNYTPQSVSNSVAQGQRIGNGDVTKSTSQSSAGSQSVWPGVSHPLTMADVVKMGRVPANHPSNPTTSTGTSYGQHGTVSSNISHESVQDRSSSASLPEEMVDELLSSEDPVVEDSSKNHESGLDVGQHVHYNEWPFVEQSAAASGSSVWKSSTSRGHTDPSVLSNMQTRMATLNLDSQSDDLQVAGDAIFESHGTEHNGADSISSRHRGFDNESYNILSSYEHHSLNHEGRAGNAQSSVPNYSFVKAYDATMSSASSALQQPRLRKDEFEALSSVNSHTVTLPNHLQVPTSNISNLSFGSYGSHNNTSYSRPSVSEGASSTEQSNSRNPEFYGQDRDSFYRTADGALDRSSSQYPQYDVAGQRHQYSSTPPGYTRESGSQLNAAQSNSQETLVNSLPHNMWTSQESEYLYNNTLNKLHALSRNAMSSNPERVPTSVYPISEPNAYMPFASQSKYMPNNNNAAYQASTLAHEIALKRALLQLRNTRSVNNLPHPSAGYSSLADFATSHGRISSATPTIDHYDILSQYNNINDLPPVSQSEQSVRWAGGLGSRTMPSPSVRQDYNFQAQKSQLRWDSGYLEHSRDLQEQILRERILGNSQVGSFQQYQEKILRERILGNSQVPPRYSQSGQFWEH